jgi:hypothetical protein
MVRDVYAGDDATSNALDRLAAVTFFVSAEPEPLVVSRIGNQLALANLAPSFFQMTTEDDLHVKVEAILAGVTAAKADLIRRKLLQLSCVLDVVLGEPRTTLSTRAAVPS